MSNSAKLVSSLGQGDGGLSESCKAGQGVCGSLNMLPTMRTGQGYYHLSAVRREPGLRPRSGCASCGVVPGSQREQGDAGMSGYRKPGHPLRNSLYMLYVMPRRLGTHRSAWIAQEQGLVSSDLRLRQVWFEMMAGG